MSNRGVLQAMLKPILGYMDPVYLQCLDHIQRLLRAVFETENRVTLSMSGTGGRAWKPASPT